jgi:hypothetical protein
MRNKEEAMMNQMRTNVGVLAVVALLGFGGCGAAENVS